MAKGKTKVNTMPDRDPRVDPREGDVVITPQGLTRKVSNLELGGRIVNFVTESGRTGSCHVIAWGAWCKKQQARPLKDDNVLFT